MLQKLINWIKNMVNNDPVKYCTVYKREGCAHVDGLLCNFPDCHIYLRDFNPTRSNGIFCETEKEY